MAELRPGQEEDTLRLDQPRGEVVDGGVPEQTGKRDRAAPRSDPADPIGPPPEEVVEEREVVRDNPERSSDDAVSGLEADQGEDLRRGR